MGVTQPKPRVKKQVKPLPKKQKKVKVKDVHVPKQGKVTKPKKNVSHPQYGTSKLEEKFAREFLDRLGVKYVYQFEAVDIGRFFDFYLPNDNAIIEIDGGYWHGDPRLYEEKDLKPHQKRAQRIDEHKEKWALMHGIPVIRFWEYDINNNPMFVMETLRQRLKTCQTQVEQKEEKKKRKVNKLKPKQLELF